MGVQSNKGRKELPHWVSLGHRGADEPLHEHLLGNSRHQVVTERLQLLVRPDLKSTKHRVLPKETNARVVRYYPCIGNNAAFDGRRSCRLSRSRTVAFTPILLVGGERPESD